MRKRMGNFRKGEEILIVVLSAALGLTVCFFSSYELAITNQGDIPINVVSIVKAMFIVSIIVIAILFIFLNLLLFVNRTIYRLMRSFMFGLLVSGYIQMLVYNGKMPAFNANAGKFDSTSLYSMINLVIMLGNVFSPVFITALNIDCEKKQKSLRIKAVVITYVCLAIVLMQLAGTIQVYAQNRKVKTSDEYPKVLTYLSYEGTTNLSKEGNIVVFVFDRLDGGWFEETLEYFPELEDILEGFTFYRDNVSGYTLTFPSVPSMITGRVYGGETWTEYLDKAWEGECVPELLHRNGYTVNANLDSSTTYANFKELAGKIDNLVVPSKEQIEDPSSVYRINYVGKDGVVQTFLKYSIATSASLFSLTKSPKISTINPGFLKLLKNIISPMLPSVMAGQKTGILFFAHQ